ncbi:MAG: DNA polymerase III subunit delta [Chloroflexota bacterium]
MLYILHGQDDFSRREALEQIKSTLGDSHILATNTTLLEGKQLTLEQIRLVCDAAPFFGSHRLLVVTGLLERFEARRGRQAEKGTSKGSETEMTEGLVRYVKTMPPSTVLVLVDGNIKANNPLLKRLSPMGTVKSFPPLRGNRLHDWIGNRVTSQGHKIAPSAIRLLAEFAGDNLWSASNEIDKLVLYASGPVITEADVRAAMSYTREANEFALVDALMTRQLDVAQRLMHQLLDEGSSAPQVLAFMVRQLSLILRAREATERGLKRQDIQSLLGVASDFALDKIVRQAKGHTIAELKQAYARILETDLAVKKGIMGDELALDILVTELCLS